jgi:hypothetical protein
MSEANTTASGWGLRYPGLVMANGGRNAVKEFTGLWGLSRGGAVTVLDIFH